MSRYQVKFKVGDETRYGVCYVHDKEYMKYAKVGKVLIEDAVLPKLWLVPEKDVIDVPLDLFEAVCACGEYEKYVEDAAMVAQQVSDALPDGVHAGSLFAIGVADGGAYYVVTKVKGKKCEVEWRGFGGGDRYTDHHFGWGGTFATSDVARYACSKRELDRLFKPIRTRASS